MAFHETRFPVAISFGASGGPARRTQIVTLASGHEERNTPWAHSRRRYEAGYGVKSLADLETVIAFFEARRGSLHGFRWRDPIDHKSCAAGQAPGASDQIIGTGDASQTIFQLMKTYSSGGQSYHRDIHKPVAGSVRVSVDGVELSDGIDFTVDATRGTLTLASAPGLNAVITAGYEFDTPVRFDTDELRVNLTNFQAGSAPNIPVIEILSP